MDNTSPPVITSGVVRMVVDGPVRRNKVSTGVILKYDLGRLRKISVPVNGNKNDISSYRAELHTIDSEY